MMNFGALKWFTSFIKYLKSIELYQPRHFTLCVSWLVSFAGERTFPSVLKSRLVSMPDMANVAKTGVMMLALYLAKLW